jgi:hypothetical protein
MAIPSSNAKSMTGAPYRNAMADAARLITTATVAPGKSV